MKPLIGSDGRQRALAIGSNFIQAHSVYSSEICVRGPLVFAFVVQVLDEKLQLHLTFLSRATE